NKPQKSTIKLGASVSNVGKGLIKRTPAAAITYAVTALLGKAVDWIMDAENNRIKYIDDAGADTGQVGIYYRASGIPDSKFASLTAASRALCSSFGYSFSRFDAPHGGNNQFNRVYCFKSGSSGETTYVG